MPKKHKVQQGEGIKKIAQKYGFLFWESIWQDAENAALRKLRSNPNILQPGDIISIPDHEKKEVTASTGQRHKFAHKVPTMKETLRLKILDKDDTPMANKPFVLTVDDIEYTGTTNKEGMLQKEIPIKATKGRIEIESNEWTLELESLNPIDEEADDDNLFGVQSRLNNLGIPCPETGDMDEATKLALSFFQRQVKISETGELDNETKTALREKHGS